MNCLAWNCRGLGNPRTIQELARLVRAQDPSVMFLIETWQDDGPLERLRCQLQFENNFFANNRNKGGGFVSFGRRKLISEFIVSLPLILMQLLMNFSLIHGV